MKKGTLLLAALVVIVLVAAFVIYTHRPGSPIASVAGGGRGRAAQPAGRAGGQQRSLAYFGITGGPSQTEPRGLLVTGFVSPPEQSPLKVIGVKEGDVILSCNGETRQMGERLYAAIEGLQQRGQKITLVVLRDGKQVTLERTEKLPAAATAQGQSK